MAFIWHVSKRRPILQAVVTVLVIGAVTGTLVFLWHDPQENRVLYLLGSMFVGVIYTSVMGGSQDAMGYWLSRRFPLTNRRAVAIQTSIMSCVTVVSFALTSAVLKLLFGEFMEGDFRGFLAVAVVAFTTSFMGHAVYFVSQFTSRLRAMEKAASEAEIRALRAQINPHFLFNSLNAIASLIRTAPEKAETVTEDLADLFRYSLKASKQPAVRLEDELQSVELYLAIEKARFCDRLTTRVDVPDPLRNARVPSLILQPLVENAIKHGRKSASDRITVDVVASETDGIIRLCVLDGGPGFDTTDLDEVLSRGTGLSNVRDRLRIMFGKRSGLKIVDSGVALEFPFDAVTTTP